MSLLDEAPSRPPAFEPQVVHSLAGEDEKQQRVAWCRDKMPAQTAIMSPSARYNPFNGPPFAETQAQIPRSQYAAKSVGNPTQSSPAIPGPFDRFEVDSASCVRLRVSEKVFEKMVWGLLPVHIRAVYATPDQTHEDLNAGRQVGEAVQQDCRRQRHARVCVPDIVFRRNAPPSFPPRNSRGGSLLASCPGGRWARRKWRILRRLHIACTSCSTAAVFPGQVRGMALALTSPSI